MSDVTWETEYSVEVAADATFAWTYMSDVRNWDDPPARFALDGPFVSGGRGTTEMPEQSARHWHLRDVRPGESYTVEFLLDGAALLFEWRFEEIDGGWARLTQRVLLAGENAAAYLTDVQGAFSSSLEPGMRRIAGALDWAFGYETQKGKNNKELFGGNTSNKERYQDRTAAPRGEEEK